MIVTAIDENSPYFQEVITLAAGNSSILGFLPKAALIEGARHRNLLIAADNEKNFLGYLLYGISGKKMLAYIVHLCVRPEYRNKKVATTLVQELKAQTYKTLHGIRVRCRRDYEASKVWPSLGFSAIGEMPGRGRKETTLTIWRLDYGHPNLFTVVDELDGSSRLKVSMDANVFYKLGETPNLENEECQALLADWLTEVIELCVTKELFNEIDRHQDKDVRAANHRHAWRFRVVSGPEDRFEEAFEALRLLFPDRLTISDKSDIRQLSRSIAAGIQFFITLDPRLLKKTDEIFEAVGIRVLRPADLILEQDSLIRETKYQPVRLAGASMAVDRARPMEHPLLNESFRAPQKETKQRFAALLNSLLADPHDIEVKVVKDSDKPQALLAFKRSTQIELEVPIMRVDRGLSSGLASTLMRYLIQELILVSAKEDRLITRITDQHLSADSIDALTESGFSPSNGIWIKINLKGVMSAQDLLTKLSGIESEVPWARQYILHAAGVVETAVASENHTVLLNIEKAFWPVKITGTGIPTFIVPILPEWAMHLFDTGVGSQNLFGGNPNLIFRVENAYYRNASPRVLRAPGRILWYVSKHSGKYQETESLRAYSYLEDVVIDRPKALFARFHRLGVYKWNDLVRLAKKDLDRNIMGFRFAKTEMLTRPISKKAIQELWQDELGKNFHIQCPLKIPEQVFFSLYSMSLL